MGASAGQQPLVGGLHGDPGRHLAGGSVERQGQQALLRVGKEPAGLVERAQPTVCHGGARRVRADLDELRRTAGASHQKIDLPAFRDPCPSGKPPAAR